MLNVSAKEVSHSSNSDVVLSAEFREHNNQSEPMSTILNQSQRFITQHKNNPLPDP